MTAQCKPTNTLVVTNSEIHRPSSQLREPTVNLIKTIQQKLKAWLKRNQAWQELNRLSDRDLRDLGLRRCEVKRSSGSYFWNA